MHGVPSYIKMEQFVKRRRTHRVHRARWETCLLILSDGPLQLVSRMEAHQAAEDFASVLILDRLERDRLYYPSNPVPIDLDTKEADLLEYLLTHPGMVWTDALRRHVWPNTQGTAVKTYVSRLRQKLAEIYLAPVTTV